mgnify:CR=1 FL=1
MKIMLSLQLILLIGFAVITSYSSQWEVFTNKNNIQDIAIADTILWAATTGGVVANPNSYEFSYTTADELPRCNINQIVIDNI